VKAENLMGVDLRVQGRDLCYQIGLICNFFSEKSEKKSQVLKNICPKSRFAPQPALRAGERFARAGRVSWLYFSYFLFFCVN
jgi:hypothetical protein